MNRSNSAWSAGKTGSPSVGGEQREVDVTRGALALVELRHVRDRAALLGGDLLRGVLVDRVLVGLAQRRAVAEVDLVLAEVALALGVLDLHARRLHVVADRAQQRLHPRGAEHGVVDVVEVGRLEVAVGLVPRLLVRVAKHDELELGAGRGAPAALPQARELTAQDLPRRRHDVRAVLPHDVGHEHHGARQPGQRAQRVEVGLEHEVAVAARPRRHVVALDGVHVDVDGEQVVAALGAVLGDLVDEVAGGEALAHEAALHVADGRGRPCRPRPPAPGPSARRGSRALELRLRLRERRELLLGRLRHEVVARVQREVERRQRGTRRA